MSNSRNDETNGSSSTRQGRGGAAPTATFFLPKLKESVRFEKKHGIAFTVVLGLVALTITHEIWLPAEGDKRQIIVSGGGPDNQGNTCGNLMFGNCTINRYETADKVDAPFPASERKPYIETEHAGSYDENSSLIGETASDPDEVEAAISEYKIETYVRFPLEDGYDSGIVILKATGERVLKAEMAALCLNGEMPPYQIVASIPAGKVVWRLKHLKEGLPRTVELSSCGKPTGSCKASTIKYAREVAVKTCKRHVESPDEVSIFFGYEEIES